MKTEMAAERRRPLSVWVATVAGVGFFPILPGTVGSAVAVVLVAALDTMPLTHVGHGALLALLVVLVFFLGVWAAGQSEKFFGRTDPGYVVIDEVAGQTLAFLMVPHASWKLLLAGFVLFRIFDITKPFPAGRAERLPGGWGIMVDDLIAGVYTLVALAFAGYIFR